LEDGTATHSFSYTVKESHHITRNSCRRKGAHPDKPCLAMTAAANAKQSGALNLIDTVTV